MEENGTVSPLGFSLIRHSRSAISIVETLLREAEAQHASDIHLEARAERLVARFRIDGALRDVQGLPKNVQGEILARLKILAGLRIDEHSIPQDGRFCFDISTNHKIDVRISIAPTYHGETAVLRILSSAHSLSTLTSLGFNRIHQEILLRAIKQPYGMILVTGPTGSGKTSTLYAILQLLNQKEVSIVTIEDPIEYAIEGITQIPITKSESPAHTVTFATGLRSVLRQDPNIIGVGEIRDSETAILATNAALTGHLVLSTLHSSDAPTALPRLLDLRVEPYLLSSTISVIISQRLVKKLCNTCKKKRVLRKDQKALIALIPGPPLRCLERYEAEGCSACNGTGTDGRIGIFEVLKMDTVLREAVQRKNSARAIYALALEQGMIPLLHDGIRKAAEGSVNLDEVLALMAE